MAFNSIPKNLAEMRKVAGSSIDKKYQAGIITFYRKVVKAHGVNDPLAFNPSTAAGKSCKLVRALKGEVDIAKLKRECEGLDSNFKITWGDGSRGNRGTGNTGNLFEEQLEKGLNDWIEEGDYKNNPYKDFIADIIKEYHLDDCQFVLVNEGPMNKSRPMKFENGNWKIGDADASNYDIGPIVTDLTLHTKCKGKPDKTIYLSLKKGGTTTMSNLGVKKIFPKEEIQKGSIENNLGLKVLSTFGIDNARFCRIFNEALNGKVTSGGNDTSPSFDRTLLQGMIRGSIGYGYHYTHKQSGNKIKNFAMTKSVCDRATRVSSVTVHYGGKTGTGQRVDITVQTPVMELKFNIRDTSGSSLPWPDKLQSAYKFNDEAIFSVPEDGYDD